MSALPRVVVTGIGLVTALGSSAAETMQRLLAGERAFAPATVMSTAGFATNLVAEVADVWGALGARREDSPVWSRSDALAVIAATEAWNEAKIPANVARRELWIAASTGGMLETEIELTQFSQGRSLSAGHDFLARHPISAPGDRVHRYLGPFAEVRTICSACSSGAVALGLALDRLRGGHADVVLAGGVDALSRLTFSGFSALSSLDPLGSRPFDVDRQGLTLGEAAAFFVLERAEDARARGAAILGELAGFAMACEAHHITAPEPGGETAVEVMRAALVDATRDVREVGYVNAHGTGTPLNDRMEAAAIARVLGERATDVAVSSQKGQLGHTLSAAGAVEAAITLLALRAGKVPPNGGLSKAEDDVSVHLVGAIAERTSATVALSSSFGFGGNDAALVLALTPASSARDAPPSRASLVVTGVATLGRLADSDGVHAAKYLDASSIEAAANETPDPKSLLDSQTSRRLDLSCRYAVFLAKQALTSATLQGGDRVGLVSGSAFASSDASAAFFARIEEKGPRFASPLEFPNLVPSSPAAHAAIVNQVRGPVLAVADLGATPFAALATSVDLLNAGRADAIVVLAAEAPSIIAEGMLSPALTEVGEGARRSGGGALVIETEAGANARGARVLAKLVAAGAVRGSRVDVGAPKGRAELVVVRDSPRLHALALELGWAAVTMREVEPLTGWHEAAASIAMAAAVARIASGEVDDVLVLHASRDRVAFARFSGP